MLCEFAVADNMIMNIQLQHTPIRRGTWISPGQNTTNQIDHVFVNAKRRRNNSRYKIHERP
jgi:hypothetical protein